MGRKGSRRRRSGNTIRAWLLHLRAPNAYLGAATLNSQTPMTRLVVLLAMLAAPALVRAQPSLVILVRHAERDTTPARDPGLTEAGAARARALMQALGAARIGSIVTTQFQRTQLTARPLADSLRLVPVVVPASSPVAAHAQAVAAAVQARPPGEAVLVVGHSNTIPAIIAALGGPRLPDLCDSQYSMMYVLEPGAGSPRLVQATYGSPDPPGEACSRTMR
jgi:phosphohistidine phosphatase SixA